MSDSRPAASPAAALSAGGTPAIGALRFVSPSVEGFVSLVSAWQKALARSADATFGSHETPHESAAWRLADGRTIIVARELEPSQETFVEATNAWILFWCDDPDAAHAAMVERGSELLNDPIATAFGTRGFFANDPSQLALYVGQPWKIPEG